MVQFSYLTLYLGIETVSMGWVDMDYNVEKVTKIHPPPPLKK